MFNKLLHQWHDFKFQALTNTLHKDQYSICAGGWDFLGFTPVKRDALTPHTDASRVLLWSLCENWSGDPRRGFRDYIEW